MKRKLIVKKRGSTVNLDFPRYPKRYEIVIDRSPDNSGRVDIKRTCENMTAWELYGVLKMLTLAVEQQLGILKSDSEADDREPRT